VSQIVPYFLILPLFALGVAVQIALLALSLIAPPLARRRPYLWRVLVGSSAGFVVANILVVSICAVPIVFGEKLGLRDDNPLHAAIGLVAGIGLLVGPLIATVVGLALGAKIGIRCAKRATAMNAEATAQP
jgi:hypothetical protein